MAVTTGVADCVVAYRAFNERSGMRFGQVQTRLTENADSTGVDNSFSYPHGLSTPAAQVAMIAKRYMHLSGATSRDFGAISVADRKHAAKNPKAYFYQKPITIEDHQNSRWIVEPLRLLGDQFIERALRASHQWLQPISRSTRPQPFQTQFPLSPA